MSNKVSENCIGSIHANFLQKSAESYARTNKFLLKFLFIYNGIEKYSWIKKNPLAREVNFHRISLPTYLNLAKFEK